MSGFDDGEAAAQPARPVRISVGGVLADTVGVVGAYWQAYFGLTLLFAVLQLLGRGLGHATASGLLIVAIAQLLVLLFGQAALARATVRALAGAAFSFRSGLGIALRRSSFYLCTIILAGLITLAGMILLIVPGIVAALALAAAPTVALIEEAGPLSSLRRSVALTRGNRWRILAVGLVVLLCQFLLLLAVIAAAVTLHALAPAALLAVRFVGAAANLVVLPFLMALAPVLYHHLHRIEATGSAP